MTILRARETDDLAPPRRVGLRDLGIRFAPAAEHVRARRQGTR